MYRRLLLIVLVPIASWALLVGFVVWFNKDRQDIVELKREHLAALAEVAAAHIAKIYEGEPSLALGQVATFVRRVAVFSNLRIRAYGGNAHLVVDTHNDSSDVARGNQFSWVRWLTPADLPLLRNTELVEATPDVRFALTGTAVPLLFVTEDGEQVLSVATPLQNQGSVRGVMVLSTMPGQIDELLSDKWLALVALCVTSLLLFVTGGVIASCLWSVGLV